MKDGFGVEPGVWFRLMLGGITGHKDFARETGVVVRPADATKVADAVVRVFSDHGDRTNRNKARLKYVIDRLGMDKVVALTEEKLGRKLRPRSAGSAGAAPAGRSRRPYRRACAEAGRAELHRRGAAGRPAYAGPDPRPRRHRPRARRRRYPPHGLAEPFDLRRAGRQGQGRRQRHQGAGALGQRELDPRRPRRLHRQCRLPLRRLRHQAACRGDRALVRSACRARHAR